MNDGLITHSYVEQLLTKRDAFKAFNVSLVRIFLLCLLVLPLLSFAALPPGGLIADTGAAIEASATEARRSADLPEVEMVDFGGRSVPKTMVSALANCRGGRASGVGYGCGEIESYFASPDYVLAEPATVESAGAEFEGSEEMVEFNGHSVPRSLVRSLANCRGGRASGGAMSCDDVESYFESRSSSGDGPGKGVLDRAIDFFETAAGGWAGNLQGYAKTLFFSLALLSFTWTMGLMVMRQADLNEFFSELVRFAMITGFFYWLLELSSGGFAGSLLDSAQQMGQEAGGGEAPTPSTFIGFGLDLLDMASNYDSSFVSLAYSNSSNIELRVAIVEHILAFIALVFISLIAVEWFLVIISFWVAAFAGIFLLGFGGARWTSDIAINYYKNLLTIVFKVFTIVLLVNFASSFLEKYLVAKGTDNLNILDFCAICIIAFALSKMIKIFPAVISSMVSGRVNAGGGEVASAKGMGKAAIGLGKAALGAVTGNGAMAANGIMDALGAAKGSSSGGGGSKKLAGEPDKNTSKGQQGGSGSSGGSSKSSQSTPMSGAMGGAK